MELARLPTVADLRARRMELLHTSIREALLDDGLDRYRPVVEPLADEYDLVDVALAAASVADAAGGRTPGDDEPELPEARLPSDRPERPERRSGPRRAADRTGPRPPNRGSDGMTRLYIGGGRQTGLRPADIVGAIANEAGIAGRAIGAIEIADRYALVEVPVEAADQVIRALSGASIRGRRLPVRREREA
jgi:ATP-dependent RNA helicase DeaD